MNLRQAAERAVELGRLYAKNPHPMGGHGDPTSGPGFDLEAHLAEYGVVLAAAYLELLDGKK